MAHANIPRQFFISGGEYSLNVGLFLFHSKSQHLGAQIRLVYVIGICHQPDYFSPLHEKFPGNKSNTYPTLQKVTCYFDNCICHQNCNCDMVLRDDASLVLVTAIYGQCGQCSPCEVQQQLKFALSTKNLATDWPL